MVAALAWLIPAMVARMTTRTVNTSEKRLTVAEEMFMVILLIGLIIFDSG